jgi:hypothetical protein
MISFGSFLQGVVVPGDVKSCEHLARVEHGTLLPRRQAAWEGRWRCFAKSTLSGEFKVMAHRFSPGDSPAALLGFIPCVKGRENPSRRTLCVPCIAFFIGCMKESRV